MCFEFIHTCTYKEEKKKSLASAEEAGLVRSTHTLWPLLLQHEMLGNYLFISVEFGAQEQDMKHLFRKSWSRAAILFEVTGTIEGNLSVTEFM